MFLLVIIIVYITIENVKILKTIIFNITEKAITNFGKLDLNVYLLVNINVIFMLHIYVYYVVIS